MVSADALRHAVQKLRAQVGQGNTRLVKRAALDLADLVMEHLAEDHPVPGGKRPVTAAELMNGVIPDLAPAEIDGFMEALREAGHE